MRFAPLKLCGQPETNRSRNYPASGRVGHRCVRLKQNMMSENKQMVESYLGKPGLVRETSRVSTLGAAWRTLQIWLLLLIPLPRHAGLGSRKGGREEQRSVSVRDEAERCFRDVVLAPDLKEQVPCVVSCFRLLTLARCFRCMRF